MNLSVKFSAILLLTMSLPAWADRLHGIHTYYPENFYGKVNNGEHGAALKKRLFTILSSAHRTIPGQHDELTPHCIMAGCYKHTSLGYNPARKILFGELHLERRGSEYAVRDVYCQHLSVPADFHHNPPGPGLIPDPAVINTEHTWPQSRFSGRFDKGLQKSDLHILYPSLAHANTSRSNYEFNEVAATITSTCPLSKRGYASSGSKKVFFEPSEVHKGNVARAIFYFAVRYQLSVAPEEEASLRAWHRVDPADRFEIQRNETIFAKQKVRNPFIDHPELVDLISDL